MLGILNLVFEGYEYTIQAASNEWSYSFGEMAAVEGDA